MTQRVPPRLIMLAATEVRAVELSLRLGVPLAAVVWPWSAKQLLAKSFDTVPLYVDHSLWQHRDGHGLAEYVAYRVVATERRLAYLARLAASGSKALN